MMSKRKPQLSVEKRLQILKELEAGIDVKTIATKYNVLLRTINRIQSNAKHIYEFAERGDNFKKWQSLKKPKHEELDARLYAWFLQQSLLQTPMSDLVLIKQATEMSKEIPSSSDFKASQGWLQKFKTRHSICLRTIYGESESTPEYKQTTENFVENFVKKIKEEGINYENIYNMNDTGLVWKTMPTKTLGDDEKKIVGNKTNKDRITIALCTNVFGTHKLKPMVINRYENPRALKNGKDCLPVIFRSEPKASANQETLFCDWYENVFKVSVKQYQSEKGIQGKVILLVDSCRSYMVTEDLPKDNFEIVFLPSNAATSLQPMNQGIILKMKKAYRHRMMEKGLSYERGLPEFYKMYNIKDCIDLVSEAWKDVPACDIRNAWKRLITDVSETVVSEVNVEEFLTCKEEESDWCQEEEADWFQEDETECKQNISVKMDQQQPRNQDQGNNVENNNEEHKELGYIFERLEWHARDMPHFVHALIDTLKKTFFYFLRN